MASLSGVTPFDKLLEKTVMNVSGTLAYTLSCSLMVASLLPVFSSAKSTDQPYNILFMAVDDLRPQTGAYGHDYMHTPHLDKLAMEGRLFKRHYIQVPTCGASRYSMLTGQLPVEREGMGNSAFAHASGKEGPPSLPHWLRKHGYYTVLTGKVTHSADGYQWLRDGYEYRRTGDIPELPGAWDEMVTPGGEWGSPWRAFFGYADGATRSADFHPPMEAKEVADAGYPDGLLADTAVATLQRLAESDRPFFYALGLFKPHLPFNAPKAYWDLYELQAIDLSGVDLNRRDGGEFWRYDHDRSALDDREYARKLRQGYFACVSYVDAQIGRVLETLTALGLDERTVVVLWGDHGYHLGERGHWGKHTLFESSMRSAYIMRIPDMPQRGVATNAITSSIDIFPTLVELAGLPLPDHLDGTSMLPMIEDPGATTAEAAIGFWRGSVTMRTDRYRLVDDQLYATESDANEEHPIGDQFPEIVNELKVKRDAILDARKALR